VKKGLLRRYALEIFVLLNALAVHLLLFATGTILGPASLLDSAITALPAFVLACLAGIAIRYLIERGSRKTHYRAALRQPVWWVELVRLLATATIAMHGYIFLKLFVPLIHAGVFDEQLARIDQALLGGLNPNALLLNLFSTPAFISFIDWSYAWIFAGTFVVAWGYFLSSPDRETRFRFAWGSALMWVTASWLYLAVPSFGPIYLFEEIWKEAGVELPKSSLLQMLVMKNYGMVLQLRAGVVDPGLKAFMGIAAFPSMHVGLHFFVFLWTRGTNRAARFVFGLFVLLIALGSVITGWHYLIDSLGGVLVAWGAYVVSLRFPRSPMTGEGGNDDVERRELPPIDEAGRYAIH
jgi:hypothetical protein